MNSIRMPPRTARLHLVSSVSWLSLTHGIASSTSARDGRPRREAVTNRARDVWMYACKTSAQTHVHIRHHNRDSRFDCGAAQTGGGVTKYREIYSKAQVS